jgi:outer membrane protein assembly factor BamB
VYAQPLFWRGGESNSGMLLAATEDNNVQALDGATGKQVWMRSLGRPIARSALRCGNINPLGVTGTPVIDSAGEALYLDAAVQESSGSPSPDFRIVA